MARLGEQIPSSSHGPLARRLRTNSSRNGLSDTPYKQKKKDRRRGKKIPSSLRGPITRRLFTKSSRTGLSDTPDKQIKTDRRRVVNVIHGIVEKILLVLFVACVLLYTILRLR
jgi:hypothetical protein